jgi:plasmid stabilization system protein ParE
VTRYLLTPRARQGLREILEYVEREFGPDAAEAVLDRLVAAFERIAHQPGIGHSREDITSDESIRFWSVAPTLIAYRDNVGVVEILVVDRGERDWPRLFPKND